MSILKPKNEHAYQEYLAGYMAACTSISVMFPFQKIIFRQIMHGVDAKHAYNQIQSEGKAKLFRGLLPPLLQKSTGYAIMFGAQNQYHILLKKHFNGRHKPSNYTLLGVSGCLAGLTEAFLTPFERVQSLLQVEKYHETYKNTYHAFKDIIATRGFKELYRGVSAICIQSKKQYHDYLHHFLTGGMIGALLSTVFYPIEVLKSHMQVRVGGEYKGLFKTFNELLNKRNQKINSLYAGAMGNFWRSVFSWGLTNSLFEYFLNRLRS